MGYTISFDASLKIKKDNLRACVIHNARDVYEREHGRQLRHSNKMIDEELTHDNVTLVNDAQGDFREALNIQEIEDYVNHRLGDVKSTRKMRKDAVIMRGLVMQLDPEYTKSATEDDVIDNLEHMIEWAIDTFGQKNIAYISSHMDETNPHLHIGFIPVTDDGRLSQKDWFKTPKHLRAMHSSLRAHMRANGYEATVERTSGARKRLSEREYKQLKDLDSVIEYNYRKRKDLDLREKSIRLKEKEALGIKQDYMNRSSLLQQRESALIQGQLALKKREEEIEEREREMEDEVRKLYDNAKVEAGKYIEEAKSMKTRLNNEYFKMLAYQEECISATNGAMDVVNFRNDDNLRKYFNKYNVDGKPLYDKYVEECLVPKIDYSRKVSSKEPRKMFSHLLDDIEPSKDDDDYEMGF